MEEFKIELNFLIRVTRINHLGDEIDYRFGPSGNINMLFDRLLDFIKLEGISDEYKQDLINGLTRCSEELADPDFPADPYLVSFIATNKEKKYSDLYLVESVPPDAT